MPNTSKYKNFKCKNDNKAPQTNWDITMFSMCLCQSVVMIVGMG